MNMVGDNQYITTTGENIMGHLLFCMLHFFALLFGFFGLFITIPLHLIYCAICK